MTLIAEKLKAAGVPLPTIQERVWRIVRDNPGITAARVTSILNAPDKSSSVSSLLSQMEVRKMVTAVVEMRRTAAPRGVGTMMRPTKVYSTNMKDYELLPAPTKTKKVAPPPPAAAPAPAPVQTTVITPIARPVPTVNGASDFVEKLTVAEARALWVVLNNMFGAKQ